MARARTERAVAGTATERRVLAVTGGVHEVTAADPRVVEVKVTAP
jgi:beta-glucosidase